MVVIEVFGNARPAGSKRAGVSKNGKLFLYPVACQSLRDWQHEVREEARRVMAGRDLLVGPLALTLEIYRLRPKGHYRKGNRLSAAAPSFPDKKPDGCKLQRAIEDALTGTVFRDDSQIVMWTGCKLYCESQPRTVIHVEEATHYPKRNKKEKQHGSTCKVG